MNSLITKEKKAEYRTMPFDEKGYEEKKADLIEEMRTLVESAKMEKRDLSHSDRTRYDEIKLMINQIDNVIKEKEEERRAFMGIDKSSETLDNGTSIVKAGVQVERRSYQKNDQAIDLGKLVRGMAGKGWEGAKNEELCYRTMSSSGNNVVIPQQLADRIVDVARSNSAIFGNIPIVQMRSNNFDIAVQATDATAGFVAEGDSITESEPTFKAVNLRGKTLALFIPIQEQLLDSATNLGKQIVTASAKAIAQALDQALLYGTGTGAQIKGITVYNDINKVTNKPYNYNSILEGVKGCKKANMNPTHAVYSTDTGTTLSMLIDTTGQYIAPPRAIDNLNLIESNNVKDTDLVVYDSEALLLGIHKDIQIEWGYVADMFKKIQKGLRIYLRADLGIVNPKGVTHVTLRA